EAPPEDASEPAAAGAGEAVPEPVRYIVVRKTWASDPVSLPVYASFEALARSSQLPRPTTTPDKADPGSRTHTSTTATSSSSSSSSVTASLGASSSMAYLFSQVHLFAEDEGAAEALQSQPQPQAWKPSARLARKRFEASLARANRDQGPEAAA